MVLTHDYLMRHWLHQWMGESAGSTCGEPASILQPQLQLRNPHSSPMNWPFETIRTLNGQFTSSPFAVAGIWGQGSAEVERPEYYAHHGPHSNFFVVLCASLRQIRCHMQTQPS